MYETLIAQLIDTDNQLTSQSICLKRLRHMQYVQFYLRISSLLHALVSSCMPFEYLYFH